VMRGDLKTLYSKIGGANMSQGRGKTEVWLKCGEMRHPMRDLCGVGVATGRKKRGRRQQTKWYSGG